MTFIAILLSASCFIFCVALSSGQTCPEPHHCTCYKNKRSATCSSNNVKKFNKLHYIPEFPDYVTYITFSGNFFESITQQTLFNLTYLKLNSLLLINNGIKKISPDAFEKLASLRRLEIIKNGGLKPETVAESLQSLNKSVIKELRLSKNNWKWLPDDMFAGLKDSKIKVIDLKLNKIRTANCTMFTGLDNLEEVSFSSNKVLHSIFLKGLPQKVKHLDLSGNNLIEMPNFCDGNSTLLPSINYLNLNDNHLAKLTPVSLKCLDKAKKIALNENDIYKLENNVLKYATSLVDFSIGYQRNTLKVIDRYAFNSSSLLSLNFAMNHFNFKIGHLNLFKFCTNLIYLNLGNNSFERELNFSQVKLVREMLLPLRKLQTLILQACGLTELPINFFQHLPYLRTLTLGGNTVSGWNDDPAIFGNITWLESLYIGGNAIRLINKTSFPVEFLTSLSNIDLSYNQFSCTCDLMWFRDWLRQNKTIKVIGWPNSYVCVLPPSWVGQKLIEFNPTKESCLLPNPVVTIAIVLSLAFVLFVVVIIVFVKYRRNIRCCFYIFTAKTRGYVFLEPQTEFTYDAFVAYSHCDNDWVHNILVPKLEVEYGYRLCLHSRDFEIGKLIVDNIVDNMKQSKNIVIVLSENFAQSIWCQFELRVSQDRLRDSDSGSLVLIMLQKIGNHNMSSDLRNLITTTPYATWAPDDDDQVHFWEQVVSAMT